MSSDASEAVPPDSAPGLSLLRALLQWLEDQPHYRLLRRLYVRHEHVGPPVLFFGGVSWDALTLCRVDTLLDNLILGFYLLLLGGFVVVAVLHRHERPLPKVLRTISVWSPGAIQFLCGGLFSAYVIYYTQSASYTTASLFLIVLVALLVANELVWERTWSTYLLIGVYFLAVFCYLTFTVPVVFGTMGFTVFLASGLLSAGVGIGLVLLLRALGVFVTPRARLGAISVVLGLFGVVTLFYVNHWIPPVPLALEDGGIYHDVRQEDDVFVLRYEEPPWYRPGQADSDPVHYAAGDTVYCFTAVFAPTALQTQIYHRWQYHDPRNGDWVDTDRIGYRVSGGRRRGCRGVTFKEHVRPGDWRVTVETADRRPIGRIRFQVQPADTTRIVNYRTRRYE